MAHTFSRGTGKESPTRSFYSLLACSTIALGLLVHLRGAVLGPTVRDVLGDALWAAMVAWLAGAIAPRAPLWCRTGAALGFCFAIEISQLWHTPGLDALRRTTAGHLVLGSGFEARDFVSYAAGVLGAALLLVLWNAGPPPDSSNLRRPSRRANNERE